MAKFRYSMHNILEVKYKLEQQAKTAYSMAKQRVDEAEFELGVLTRRRLEYVNHKKELMSTVLDVQKIKQCQEGIRSFDHHIDLQKKKIAALEAVLDDARRKLQEVMKDRKTHEKLKENEFEDFKQELLEEEKKEIDELVSYTYNKPKQD